MRVLCYDECAERANVVRRTFERAIAEGYGPPVVEITARRRGVLELDFNEWLLARRRPAPGSLASPPAKRGRGRPRQGPANG